jgi:hypothetical protein
VSDKVDVEARCTQCGHQATLTVDEIRLEGVWKDAMAAKDKEIERLTNALYKYGEHAPNCWNGYVVRGEACRCGFWKALEQKP